MLESKFVHIVNFWLKKSLSESEVLAFENGLKSLSNIETMVYFNIGTPASTDRPVIDRSYSYCLLTVFADDNGHDIYQKHPIHLKFVEECKLYWEKVVIFDNVSI